MPKDLPGLYWDQAKGRYFPLASRPSTSHGHPQGSKPFASKPQDQTLSQRSSVPDTNNLSLPDDLRNFHASSNRFSGASSICNPLRRLQFTSQFAERTRISHEILCKNIALNARATSFVVDEMASNELSSLSSLREEFLWALRCLLCVPQLSTGCMRTPLEAITSILNNSSSGVPFGNRMEIAVQSASNEDLWSVLRVTDKSCHDIRCANLLDSSLLLGAAGRGILLADFATTSTYQILPTGSDVLSVFQLPHLAYTGCRNGSVRRFDTRTGGQRIEKGQDILDGQFRETNSSITHLSVIQEWQMLVSTIRGDLELFDLRFINGRRPLLSFAGHTNSYTLRLGLAVSPCESMLFAASDDRRVRAWSLRDGTSILGASKPHIIEDVKAAPDQDVYRTPAKQPTHPRLLQDAFPSPILSMQVTESTRGDGSGSNNYGLCLWAICGPRIYRYWLGQHDSGFQV
ncbi:hypothetical protein NLI96_g1762 [Meripilus lineatus]|uniref:Uncharacterized protein n=1 Tax=Meripilus lineatus TaxID=2056292 RepID=A0AAD5VCC5_9APHY|nr:hypothetical protein NLI96_g1762 [Physisporinus lineatus]